jgi:hypothetical protein
MKIMIIDEARKLGLSMCVNIMKFRCLENESDKAMTNYKGPNWQTLVLGKSKKPHNYTMRLVIVCLEVSVSTLVQ